MAFAGISYTAIIAAAAAAFLFGGVYYGALSKQWLEASEQTMEEVQKTGLAVPLTISAICLLVMAWVLAGIIGHLGPGQVTIRNGLISGAFCWLGFVLTTVAMNHAYQGSKRALTLIDTGHWLGVLLIQGAVIGWFARAVEHVAEGAAMMHLSVVSVPVSDQERAKAFYRDVLGFQLIREDEATTDRRWIHMKPPSGLTGISLVTWFEAMPPGSVQGLVLDTGDIDRAHAKLKGAGLDIAPIQDAS